MKSQEPNPKPRALIQIWVDPIDIERAKNLPDYHFGLIVHLARTGYLRELEKAEKEQTKPDHTEKIAS
jgi:hypothetical protein